MGQYFAINLVNFFALKLWAYYRVVFCNKFGEFFSLKIMGILWGNILQKIW